LVINNDDDYAEAAQFIALAIKQLCQ